MSVSDRVRWAACLAGTVVLCVSASGQDRPVVPEGFVRLDADDIKAGTLYGDTRKPGMYVQRVRFGPGQGTKPHYHDQDVEVTGTVSGAAARHACPAFSFSVGSTAVTTSAATRFEDVSCAAVVTGVRVEVKGTRTAASAIAATKVEKK